MRDAYGHALKEAASTHADLLVLDADNATSTRTDWFSRAHPDRFVNLGIAEQNAMGFAAGLALAGFRPLVNGFAAMLVNRAYDQIMHSVAYQGLPVKIAGHYAGLSAAREGAVHHATADLALMRAVPGMEVVIPACDADVPEALEMVLRTPGAGYLRLSRDEVSDLPAPSSGSLAGGVRVWGEPGCPCVVVVAGACTPIALRAAEDLAANGTDVTVVCLSTLKPLPEAALSLLMDDARVVVTVEEHNVIGGVGSAISEFVAARRGPAVVRHGVHDRFTESGSSEELAGRYGFTSDRLAELVLDHAWPGSSGRVRRQGGK